MKKFFEKGDSLRAKICGLTNQADAELALAAGTDALGFNFFPESRRFLDFEKNREWISRLDDSVARVAVVVNPEEKFLTSLRDSGCFDAVQFHGDETPEFCAQAGFPLWMRAVRVKNDASFEEALQFDTPHLLLDAWSAHAYGGTGKRLDWDAVRSFVLAHPDRQVVLAGGLTPNNVRDAVRIVRPQSVDVASGVELDPGHKNEYLMREFLNAARAA